MAETKILIVEDESIVAKDIENMLKRMGYSVSGVASSGEKAIQEIETDLPDIVLMDIMLKGSMDGVETAEKIRSRFHIPLVYLTAYSDESTLQRAKITEPYGYITKPFQERELHIAIDIALYKHQMERKLKESEQWLSTTLKSIGDAVIATDVKGRITFMNTVAEALTGWDHIEARDKLLEEVFNAVNEETKEHIDNPVTRVINEDIIIGLANHTILINRDGKKVPIDDSASPIKDEDDNLLGVVLVFRDVTQRRKSDRALRESEEMFRAVFETAQDSIFIKDNSLRYIRVNPTVEKLFGLQSDEILGKTDIDLFGEETGSQIMEEDQKVLSGELIEEEPTKPIRGNPRIFHTIKVPLRDSEGNIFGLCGFARDITDRKKMEAELIKAQKLESIGILAGGIAHDFNNILTGILGNVSLAKLYMPIPEKNDTLSNL
jgi:PAS domain S-box-containing protein